MNEPIENVASEHANDSYNDIRWDLHKFTQVSLPLSAYSSQQRERDRRGVFVMFVGHIDRQVGKLLSTQMTSPPPRTDLDNKLISVEI